MITNCPIFYFLRSVCGSYTAQDNEMTLDIISNGYSIVFMTKGFSKGKELYGLVGIRGKSLELHLSLDAPNIMVFKHTHDFKDVDKEKPVEILFSEEEIDLHLKLEFKKDQLTLTLLNGKRKTKEIGLTKESTEFVPNR